MIEEAGALASRLEKSKYGGSRKKDSCLLIASERSVPVPKFSPVSSSSSSFLLPSVLHFSISSSPFVASASVILLCGLLLDSFVQSKAPLQRPMRHLSGCHSASPDLDEHTQSMNPQSLSGVSILGAVTARGDVLQALSSIGSSD